MSSAKLSIAALIAKYIKENNFTVLCDIKVLCDKLHEGADEATITINKEEFTYTAKELPSDSVYEQLEHHLETLVAAKAVEATVVTHSPKTGKYHMGSIPKKSDIQEITNAIIMPKYDGCSCGLTFVRGSDGIFTLEQGRTRGTIEAKAEPGQRKFQIVTDKVRPLCHEILGAFNSKDAQDYEFEHGTWKDVREVIVRAEIVLKNEDAADGSPPANVVAGKLNGGHDVWFEFIENIELKPYEIVSLVMRNMFAITQLETISFFSEINLPVTFTLAKQLRSTPKSLAYIKNLYETKFNQAVENPIDGVVYCAADWKYPFDKLDNSKENYGKYAWKPSTEGTTDIKEIIPIVSKDGFIEFRVNYSPILMNKSTCKTCVVCPTSITNFNGAFGIGSLVTIKFVSNNNPHLATCEAPSGDFTPFELPKRCPFCQSKTEITNVKGVVRVKCPSERCIPKLVMLCKSVNKTLDLKGVAEGTINKFFDSQRPENRTAYQLYVNPSSKASEPFKELTSRMTIGKFFNCVFPSVRGPKQLEKIYAAYGASGKQLELLSNFPQLIDNFEIRIPKVNEAFANDIVRAIKFHQRRAKK